ncbi:MAG: CRISPR-associated endonuclease Cas2 [Succinivibrio sp.]
METPKMILLSYDISNDKLRTKFSKFLSKFGHRLQYSVFEIDNSESMLDNIIIQIKANFEKHFSNSDSIMIMKLSPSCKITRMGYAKNEDETIIIV